MRALYRKQGALNKQLLKSIFKNVWNKEKDLHIFAHTKQQQHHEHSNFFKQQMRIHF
jgi:hypothetical protein